MTPLDTLAPSEADRAEICEDHIPDGYLTTGEAAKIAKVSQQTIIRCVDQGQLPGVKKLGSKFRKIHVLDLYSFLRLHKVPTDGFGFSEEQTAAVARLYEEAADDAAEEVFRVLRRKVRTLSSLGIDEDAEQFTTGDIAAILQESQQSVIRALDAGVLEGHKVLLSKFRRMTREKLLDYMRKNGMDTGILEPADGTIAARGPLAEEE